MTSHDPGQHLAGRYRIVSALGGGDIGEVYAAVDQHGDRECAVKLLTPQVLATPAAWSTFQETCRSVSNASTDAIARVSDFAVDASLGRAFFACERIGFPSLAQLVAARGAIPLELWLAALDGLAQSLDAAARLGVPHGNLKPQNLFFSPERPSWGRVSDFGIAGLRAALASAPPRAAVGWAPLEQLHSGAASSASDVYALGLVTFYALTGRHYLRSMWQAMPSAAAVEAEQRDSRAHASEHAASVGAPLPASIDEWFARALHADPAQRYPGAVEAYAALQAAADHGEAPPARASGASLAFAPTAPAPPLAAAGPHGTLPGPPPAIDSHPAATVPDSNLAAPSAVDGKKKPSVPLLVGAGLGLLALAGWAAAALLFSDPPGSPPTASSPRPPVVKAGAEGGEGRPAGSPTGTRARFDCTPEPCEWIVCDGKKVPKGSWELDVAPGQHTCSASRKGYRTAVIEFNARVGEVTRVPFELLAVRAAAATKPKRAAPAAAPRKSVAQGQATSAAKASRTSKTGAAATSKTPPKPKPIPSAKPAKADKK